MCMANEVSARRWSRMIRKKVKEIGIKTGDSQFINYTDFFWGGGVAA